MIRLGIILILVALMYEESTYILIYNDHEWLTSRMWMHDDPRSLSWIFVDPSR